MAERSKHYNWFQGGTDQQDPKGKIKKNAKVTWKFAKIFLYFSLFFFSMWGCVQVFTHKLETKTTAGVTFANGDSELSPQVNKIIVKKDKAGDIYLDKKDNGFLNPNISKEQDVLLGVNKQLKENLGVSSPTKARKGGNYVVKLLDEAGNDISTNNNNGFLTDEENKLLTYTSADIKDAKPETIGGVAYDTYFDFKRSISILKKLFPKPIKFYKVDKSGKIEYSYDFDFNKITELKGTKSHKLAFYFNVNLLKQILESKSFGKDIETIFKDASSVNIPIGTDITKNRIDDFNKVKKRDVFFNKVVNAILGINYKIPKKPTNTTLNAPMDLSGISFASSPLGFRSSTNWLPITTWGLAWSKDGGTGPFYGIFVFPIAYVTNEIVNSMPMMKGWESLFTIVIVVVALSILMFAMNFKNTLQQTKMQELSAKKAVIDAKYLAYKGNKQMENRQKQEVSQLYKKEGISPLSQIGSAFLKMPFFLAMWRVVGSIDHLKATEWVGINFATTSWRALFGNLSTWENGWAYFPLILLAVGFQLLATLLPKILTKRRNKNRMNVQQKEAMKKSDKTQKIMMIVTLFFPLITTAGLQIYFIIRSLWTITELMITHKILIHNKRRAVAKGIK